MFGVHDEISRDTTETNDEITHQVIGWGQHGRTFVFTFSKLGGLTREKQIRKTSV